ncbi:MAG: family 16 glycosylhydrolase [Verrucomicrobiota bacterium]
MNPFSAVRLAALLLTGVLLLRNASAQNLPGWSLVWSDEFTQADGTAPDPAKWGYDIGGNGWGNSELEYYTARTNNVRIEGGQLVIEARAENYQGKDYTSGRILTRDKWSWAYGRFEARIKIPRGQGIWPAFWMLGSNIGSVNWPTCGEIDIMENIGREPNIVHGTIHGPGYSAGNSIGGPCTLPGGGAYADDFHIYAVEWETNRIRWYMDNQLYFTVTPSSLPSGTQWVFTQPQFLLLNLAVGGTWPGYPDGTTVFPQRMTVDYVRVYTRSAIGGCGANVLTNPGFDNGGLGNWSTYGGNTSLETALAHSGANSFKVFGQFTGAENYSGAFQDVACSSGNSYRADAWLLTPSSDKIAGANTAWVEVSFRDAAANILELYRTPLMDANSPAGVWLNLPVTNQVNPANGALIGTTSNLIAPSGTAFVRQQIVFRQLANAGGSVRFDDLNLFQSAGAVPPAVENLSPDGSAPSVDPTNKLSFQATSPCAGIAANAVRVELNGVDVSPLLTLTGSATNWNVSFSGLASNVLYSAAIIVTDVNGLSTSNAWQFNTFSENNVVWEAEDFDYSGGQFIANPVPSSTAKTNSYFGRVGQQNIDKNETSMDGDHLYRASDTVATLLPTDFTRQKYLNAINAGDVNAKDYKVGYFYPGEWLNYTRDFPQGDYYVYGRLAGGAGATALYLDRVSAGQGTSSQTTVRLGTFGFVGNGWQTFDFIPLRDTNGSPVVVSLAGVTTLRVTATGGTDPNYFMLVPTRRPVAAAAARSGGDVHISFSTYAGLNYQVLYKNDLSAPSWLLLAAVVGDGLTKSVLDPLGANMRFYRVVVL